MLVVYLYGRFSCGGGSNERAVGVIDIPALVSLMHDFYMEVVSHWTAIGLLRRSNRAHKSGFGPRMDAMTDGTCMGYVVLSVRFAMEYGGMSAI